MAIDTQSGACRKLQEESSGNTGDGGGGQDSVTSRVDTLEGHGYEEESAAVNERRPLCSPLPMSHTKCRIPLYEWKKNGREMMNLPEVFNQTGRSGGE